MAINIIRSSIKMRNIKRKIYLRKLEFINSSRAYAKKLDEWVTSDVSKILEAYDDISKEHIIVCVLSFKNRLRDYKRDIDDFEVKVENKEHYSRFEKEILTRVQEMNNQRDKITKELDITFK